MEAPGEDEVGALPVLGGLRHQQHVRQYQAWQGGGHAHGHSVGPVVHVHRGPSIGYLGGPGRGAGTTRVSYAPLPPPQRASHPRQASQLPLARRIPQPGSGVSRPSCPSSARGAQRAGDLDEVTLEHGQRAEGQVFPLLEGLLQLAQSGDPLRGAPERLRTPHVPEPVHGRCRKDGSPGGAEAGTRHPDAWLPRPPSQPTGPSPSDFSCSSG